MGKTWDLRALRNICWCMVQVRVILYCYFKQWCLRCRFFITIVTLCSCCCRYVYLIVYFVFQETSLWSMSAVFSTMGAAIIAPLIVSCFQYFCASGFQLFWYYDSNRFSLWLNFNAAWFFWLVMCKWRMMHRTPQYQTIRVAVRVAITFGVAKFKALILIDSRFALSVHFELCTGQFTPQCVYYICLACFAILEMVVTVLGLREQVLILCRFFACICSSVYVWSVSTKFCIS